MYTSLPELSKWHQKNLTVPIYDPNFSAYFGAPGAGGAWQVTRYHDVLAVLADHATFLPNTFLKQMTTYLHEI